MSSWPHGGGGPVTPTQPPMDLAQFYEFEKPRTTPPPVVAAAPEQPAPPSASGLLPYDRYGLRIRARLNRTPHVVASGGSAAAA
jgi:hypothetical protein